MPEHFPELVMFRKMPARFARRGNSRGTLLRIQREYKGNPAREARRGFSGVLLRTGKVFRGILLNIQRGYKGNPARERKPGARSAPGDFWGYSVQNKGNMPPPPGGAAEVTFKKKCKNQSQNHSGDDFLWAPNRPRTSLEGSFPAPTSRRNVGVVAGSRGVRVASALQI